MKNLEQYLRSNFANNVIDHSIRVWAIDKDTVTFYIHPSNTDGDTLDFKVSDNNLFQLNVKSK